MVRAALKSLNESMRGLTPSQRERIMAEAGPSAALAAVLATFNLDKAGGFALALAQAQAV
jgi:hypothetical protein